MHKRAIKFFVVIIFSSIFFESAVLYGFGPDECDTNVTQKMSQVGFLEENKREVPNIAEDIQALLTQFEASQESNNTGFAQEAIEFCKIMGMSIAAAVLYGTMQDQITARVCIEYFNSDLHPGHKNFLLYKGYENPKELSPTHIGFFFGFYATWWVGLGLGLPLAFAARAGNTLPKIPVKDLVKPIAVLLSVMAVGSLLSGLIGYNCAKDGLLILNNDQGFDADTCNRFIANGSAHNAAYALGIIGGIGMCLWIMRKRINLKHADQQNLLSQLKVLIKELHMKTAK